LILIFIIRKITREFLKMAHNASGFPSVGVLEFLPPGTVGPTKERNFKTTTKASR